MSQMISTERFVKLDEYFYGNRAARRRDFLISTGMGFAALAICKIIGVNEIYSLVICTVFITASMLVLVSRYNPHPRRINSSSKSLMFWVGLPISAIALVLIGSFFAPSTTEQIVSQIEDANNPALQHVALVKAAYIFQQQAREKRRPNESDLADATNALLRLTDTTHAPPEAWKAAASLISYRSAALIDFKTRTDRPCVLQNLSPSLQKDKAVLFWLRYRDCTFDLNDLDYFYSQHSTQKMNDFTGNLTKVFYFNFNDVTVKFDPSKPSVPFAGLTFDSCLLEISSDKAPLLKQEPMLRAFLDKQELRFTIGQELPSGIEPSM